MRRAAFAGLIAIAGAAPAATHGWTPHSAAALLDATFPTATACQTALDDARRRETHARAVRGLSYTHLFEQGACRIFHRDGETAWRIRMEWVRRTCAGRAPDVRRTCAGRAPDVRRTRAAPAPHPAQP